MGRVGKRGKQRGGCQIGNAELVSNNITCRFDNTFQDRLIPELRLHDINDMDAANHYLQREFIPSVWDKTIRVVARNDAAEFTPVPEHIDLNDVCVMKDYRKIRSDHTFSYGNTFYLIESPLKRSIANQRIEIRTKDDNGFTAYFAGRRLEVSEVIEPTKNNGFSPTYSEVSTEAWRIRVLLSTLPSYGSY